jgi:RNA ligase
MPVHLSDILDFPDLELAIDEGYIRQQTHPAEPLAILNYTEKCAYEEAWNDTTKACRGLIYRTDTWEVVARGFMKFFNYGQSGAADISLDAPVHVTDKVDGSLGIIYPVPSGGWAVATRGSFTSDQAIHATQVLRERYADYEPHPAVTALVEIVYPQNRVVLDYGNTDDLILLGGVALRTGTPVSPALFATWTGPKVPAMKARTFAEALALEPRPNAEGIVVRDLMSDAMVKIKQADYIELHRIVTNLTARKIHDWLLTGKPVEEFIAPLPDEFHPWCRQIIDDIDRTVEDEYCRLHELYTDVAFQVPADWDPTTRDGRKVFAVIALEQPQEDRWALFAQLDGRDIRPELLKRARPAPFLTPTGRTYGEDVA